MDITNLLRTALPKDIFRSVVLALTISVSLASAQKQDVSKPGIDRERLATCVTRMKSFVEKGSTAGAVMLVARRNEVISLEAVGYQDLESKKAMRPDTIFDIRSVTKPVTAIGIMILMEDGKLTLDDPVEKYLPEFKKPLKTSRSFGLITIHHLLTHTGGLPLYRLPVSEEIAIKRNQTLAEYVAFLSKQEPESEPGTQFRYSSGGFAILGRIIEVVSGKPYEQFMKERLFDPLGMKDSSFFVPIEKLNRLASIYRKQDGKLNKWEELEAHARKAKYPGPEFGMYSTAADLSALCRMMLAGGSFKGKRVLSQLSVAVMTENQTVNLKSAITHAPAYQGLGWGLTGDPTNDFPLTSPGSFGHNGAFGAIIWIDPKKDLIRIFLQHRFGPGNESDTFMAMAGAAIND